MKEKINIAEILRDKPINTKLYSPLFGDVYFSHVKDSIINVKHHAGESKFLNSGRYYNYDESEPLLFPSKLMRDWEKFAWKKGNVLVNSRGLKILFDRWANDNYTSFYAKTINLVEDAFLDTNLHTLASEKEAKSFIKCIEEKLGGKLNLETLEIEKQPEFKDGDILYAEKDEEHVPVIFILNSSKEGVFYYASLTLGDYILCDYKGIGHVGNAKFRFATEEEKKKLFDILAIENKAWDAVKKQIVDLKTKIELKPFDKVLVKDYPYRSWEPALFWKKVDVKDLHPYMIIGGKRYRYCEPYEGNEYLLDD